MVLLFLTLLSAADAGATVPLPKRALVYTDLTGVRINPLGAANQLRLGWCERLSESNHPLWAAAHVQPSITATITPANVRLGGGLELAPMAALVLYAGYEFIGYYGVLQHLQSYKSNTANYSDGERGRGSKRGENYPSYGGLATLSVLLQGKVGPVAMRSQLQIFHVSLKLKNGDKYYYDPWTDIAAPGEGWFLTNDADLLFFIPNSGFVVGARHTLVHTIDVEAGGAYALHHRIGPLAIYQFFDHPGAAFNKPAVVVMAQWFMQHRYRTGVDTPTALPQITIAFMFSGTLLSLD